MKKLPDLFLDVDGVLNSFGVSPWPDSKAVDVMNLRAGHTFPFRVSRAMGAAILALPVEIRWLSTWFDDCNMQVAPVVFGDVTHFEYCGSIGWNRFEKWPTIQEFLEHEPGRPFIWIDDDAIPYPPSTKHRMIDEASNPSLLISPWHQEGLTPEHLTMIEEWIAALEEG